MSESAGMIRPVLQALPQICECMIFARNADAMLFLY